ncbi:MAG: hypothetical protein AAF191_06970 [Verrucomicrobiota bacterium]
MLSPFLGKRTSLCLAAVGTSITDGPNNQSRGFSSQRFAGGR